MKHILILILTVFLTYSPVHCQKASFKPSFSVALDTSKGSILLKQCSRSIPQNVKGFWILTQTDITDLEVHFANIKEKFAKQCCITGGTINNLQSFAFQYLGVFIKGKKYIYINAFPFGDIDQYKKYNSDPITTPIVICDGGEWYWGALFDPQTKKFSSLSFNGYG